MKYLVLFLKGFAMGAANVIPGVSGGTIAFITGIYFRLITALKHFDLAAIVYFLQLKWRSLADHIDLYFLLVLGTGLALSLLTLAKVMTWALGTHEILTLSFFFGLIVASILGVGRQLGIWNINAILAFMLGTSLALAVAFLPPAQPNEGFIYLILCGMVAVCSMILPGLSGSYILLLMGNYALVLQAIGDFKWGILAPVGIGVVIGLVGFSRLLSWLFEKYKDATIALLTGFVTGSLLIIWPWKTTVVKTLSNGKKKAIGYDWYWPELNVDFGWALLLVAMGFILVYLMDRRSPVEN